MHTSDKPACIHLSIMNSIDFPVFQSTAKSPINHQRLQSVIRKLIFQLSLFHKQTIAHIFSHRMMVVQ